MGLTSVTELREYLGNETRMTQYGHFDIYDVIAKLYGCSREQARYKFKDLRKSGQGPDDPSWNFRSGINPRPEDPSSNHEIQWEKHQFPGERQKPTPVANFLNVRNIMCLLPGEIGQAIRSRMHTVHFMQTWRSASMLETKTWRTPYMNDAKHCLHILL